jgi:hypothetical protein
VTNDRKLATNRQNARRSTGPKSLVGKRNSSRNSLRHGLAVPARSVADLQEDIKAIARAIARASGRDEITEMSLQAAEAQVELFRTRNVCAAIRGSELSCEELNIRLASLERYERRAFSRRNRALRAIQY